MEILLKDLSERRSKDTMYPKLRMAVETGQKEFVGHMYSQQVSSLQPLYDHETSVFRC